MTYWLTENSMVPMVTGIILSLIFLIVAFNSREKVLYYIAIGIAALTFATVACEQMIVTDKEEVESLLNQLSRYASNNDLDSILEHISDDKPETKQAAAADMARCTINSCTILGTNYFEGPEPGDSSAEICFAVSVSGTFGNFHEGNGTMKFTVNFDNVGEGEWKITDYRYDQPMAGLNL